MFQTNLNHFFQSFASEPLTTFMRFISALGYTEFFMIFLLIMLFAVNFKKGFILFMVLLWTAVFTFMLKDYFDLPRPFQVDRSLQMLDGELLDDSEYSIAEGGPLGFWDPIPDVVLVETRKSGVIENGFPSGHTSVAVAFWGTMMLLFRKKWVHMISISLMILIPLSRVYLGVHFVADILGGIVVGVLMLGLFYMLVLSPKRLPEFLNKDRYTIGLNVPSIILLLAPVPFLFVLPPRVAVIVGIMVGIGLGYLLLSRKGIPSDEGTIVQRIGRVLLGLGAAALIGLMVKSIFDAIGIGEEVWSKSLILFMLFVVLIWVGTEISIKLGMFQRKGVGIKN